MKRRDSSTFAKAESLQQPRPPDCWRCANVGLLPHVKHIHPQHAKWYATQGTCDCEWGRRMQDEHGITPYDHLPGSIRGVCRRNLWHLVSEIVNGRATELRDAALCIQPPELRDRILAEMEQLT